MIGTGDVIQVLRDYGPMSAITMRHILETQRRHGNIEEIESVLRHCVDGGEVEATRVGVDGSTGATIYIAEPAPLEPEPVPTGQSYADLRGALQWLLDGLNDDYGCHIDPNGDRHDYIEYAARILRNAGGTVACDALLTLPSALPDDNRPDISKVVVTSEAFDKLPQPVIYEAIETLLSLHSTLEGEWCDPAAYGMEITNPDHNHYEDWAALDAVVGEINTTRA